VRVFSLALKLIGWDPAVALIVSVFADKKDGGN